MKNPMKLLLLLPLLLFSCDLGDPVQTFTVSPLDIRGLLFVSEVHWAGTVDNTGANADPDDDYIELYNSHEAPLPIGGWSVVISGSVNLTIVIPPGSIVASGATFTIGRTTGGAFANFNYICPELVIPNATFSMSVADGQGKVSDSLTLVADPFLPAGKNLPGLKASAVRLLDGYGVGLNGTQAESWVSYTTNEETWAVAQAGIRNGYRDAVQASPGVMDYRSGW